MTTNWNIFLRFYHSAITRVMRKFCKVIPTFNPPSIHFSVENLMNKISVLLLSFLHISSSLETHQRFINLGIQPNFKDLIRETCLQFLLRGFTRWGMKLLEHNLITNKLIVQFLVLKIVSNAFTIFLILLNTMKID